MAYMVTRQVIISKEIGTEPITGREVAQPGTEVKLGTLIGAVQAALGEEQVVALVIQRSQQVKLRVFQREVLIRVQLHTGGAEAAQPLLQLTTGCAGRHPARHGSGGLAVRVVCQETACL